jgi:hypothetical protein
MKLYEVLDKYDIKLSEEQEANLERDLISSVKYELTEELNSLLERYMVAASSNQNSVFYTFLREYTKIVKNYGS